MAEVRGYETVEDRYLVAASLAGSAIAYSELARRYRGALTLIASRYVSSWETAQDVAQEAIIAAFRQIHSLKDPAHFGPWIRTIAVNSARRLAKREGRHVTADSDEMERFGTMHDCRHEHNPVETLLRKEQHTAIRALVQDLPIGTRTVVDLYYGEQWTVGQIAVFLELPQTTVKWRLHAGRKEIAKRLEAWTDGASEDKVKALNERQSAIQS